MGKEEVKNRAALRKRAEVLRARKKDAVLEAILSNGENHG